MLFDYKLQLDMLKKYTDDACYSVLNFPDLQYNATVVFISRYILILFYDPFTLFPIPPLLFMFHG